MPIGANAFPPLETARELPGRASDSLPPTDPCQSAGHAGWNRAPNVDAAGLNDAHAAMSMPSISLAAVLTGNVARKQDEGNDLASALHRAPARPTDPRQAEIVRLLRLIGGAPAAYFTDACRLMDGDATLESTTHLVAHLLRELDATLIELLRPMVPADQWPDRSADNAHRRKIELVCDVLRVPANDDLRGNWHAFASGLHRRAHRHGLAAPRPNDAAFGELWQQGQAVIYEVARRIEASFTQTLPIIEAVATGKPDMHAFRHQVLQSTVPLDRFFETASPAWFAPLRAAGHFAAPPPLEYDENGSVTYARWPQGRFLARMASTEPEAVIELGVNLETDNPEAHEAFVGAACVVSAAIAANLVPTVVRWLATPVQWALPLKVRELIRHLVDGGEVEAGLSLLEVLGRSAGVGHDHDLAGELIDQMLPEIFPAAGVRGLEILVELLQEQVAAEAYGEHDHSSIWRPHLERGRRDDSRDLLVSAVRDAADSLVLAGTAIGVVIAVLEEHGFSIFRRLALGLLARHPDAELIAAHLVDDDLFHDMAYTREYGTLSREHFRSLSQEAQATILGWVEAAPRYENDAEGRRRWQRRVLERLGHPLPGEWEARLDALADVDIEPEPEAEFGFVAPRSPLGEAELAAMAVGEIIAILRDWQPEGDDWRAPSVEGLGRTIERVVAVDPDGFAAAAAGFRELEPTYVRALVSGLRRARAEDRPFAWSSVLGLLWAIRERPRVIVGRDPRGFDRDPGWKWAWQEGLHLIDAGFTEGAGQLPRDERERVWRLIEHYLDDADPSADDDLAGGPATRALNSIRGMATRNAFRYGWWLRGDVLDPDRRLPDELAAALTRRLAAGVEDSAAVRSVFGEFFPHLVACDEAFAAQQVAAIFPADEQHFRAAWQAYLRANKAWISAFRLLGEQYRRGVEELDGDGAEDDLPGHAGEGLAVHLMSLYAMGEIELDGELLARFYELASVERRAEALEVIGRGLERADVPEEAAARLRRLFERRLDHVRSGGDGEELRGFAWWFASGTLGDEWSLARLRELLAAGSRIHPDHVVAARLAEIRKDYLLAAVELIELLIETGTRNWFVLGARQHIRAIVSDALAAGGDAESRARDVIGRLAARGHREFEGLLPG